MTSIIPAVSFWVDGVPKPQGSKRAFRHPSTDKIILMESAGKALKDWRMDVKIAAHNAMVGNDMIVQPDAVKLQVRFVLHRPTSLPKTKATPLAVKKPDLDKLLRGVCDALTGKVYADDSQVVVIESTKETAELGEATGAQITVMRLSQ